MVPTTADSESLSPGSNPGPAATRRPSLAGLFLLVAFPEPSWSPLDSHGVIVAVMVKTIVEPVEGVTGMLRPSPTSARVIRDGLARDVAVSTTVVCEARPRRPR